MDDLEDIVEAVVDIEDIVEEVTDPEELFEDFIESPLLILLALGAVAAAVVTALLVVATLLFVVFAGPVLLVGLLALAGFGATALAVGAFVYLRTDIPSDVQRKIETALEQSDDTRRPDAEMTETEAISAIKNEYADGNLDDYELEQALDDVLTSDRPETVVERHRNP
jgi:membrane protein implicated in regulation of membrane protease activity